MYVIERQFVVPPAPAATSSRLRNLELVVSAHDRAAYVHHEAADELGAIYREQSSTPDPKIGTRVDRSADEIVRPYDGIAIAILRDFARGGIVLDIGPGTSYFLDAFSGCSKTVAVDTHGGYVKVQADRGHRAINEPADDMSSLESGSVKLSNASSSVPLWNASPDEAIRTFREQVRVLERGGIGLVDPLVRDDLRDEWEEDISQIGNSGQLQLSAFKGEGDLISHTAAAFSREVIEAQKAGIIRVALFRSASTGAIASRTPSLARQIPQSMMFQKIR